MARSVERGNQIRVVAVKQSSPRTGSERSRAPSASNYSSIHRAQAAITVFEARRKAGIEGMRLPVSAMSSADALSPGRLVFHAPSAAMAAHGFAILLCHRTPAHTDALPSLICAAHRDRYNYRFHRCCVEESTSIPPVSRGGRWRAWFRDKCSWPPILSSHEERCGPDFELLSPASPRLIRNRPE